MLEVITPGSESYTTLAEFKTFYGITDSAKDVYWTGLLVTAGEMISDYCGRPLCSEAVRETLRSGQAQEAFVLQRWPVSVTPVVTYGPGNVVVNSAFYEVAVRTGIVKPLASSGEYSMFDPGVWKITYSGGYVAIPARVKEAVWRLAYEGDGLAKMRAGLKSRRIEGVVTEVWSEGEKISDEVPAYVKQLLRRYVER